MAYHLLLIFCITLLLVTLQARPEFADNSTDRNERSKFLKVTTELFSLYSFVSTYRGQAWLVDVGLPAHVLDMLSSICKIYNQVSLSISKLFKGFVSTVEVM
jgi:hypothetical protein